ncbi:hypothetical protein DKP78_21495, partial [Enterococcus faecium]
LIWRCVVGSKYQIKKHELQRGELRPLQYGEINTTETKRAQDRGYLLSCQSWQDAFGCWC